jgi:hypothetical protein
MNPKVVPTNGKYQVIHYNGDTPSDYINSFIKNKKWIQIVPRRTST